jgi:hypothetical protein
VVFVVGDTDCVPDTAFVPVHPFDAVHEVALVELQVRVALWPEVILVELVVRVAVGATGAELTLIVTLCSEVVPPAPVHVSEYVVLVVGDTDCVPDVALVPVQPPLAVHDVALVDDQVNVAD